MSTRNVDVGINYVLRTVDKGVRQAVALNQDLGRVTQTTQRQLDAALRANSLQWKDTARVAAAAQRHIGEETSRAASQVDKSMLREVESLRRAGVGYKEIAAAAKGWGATAQATAATVKRAADEEIRHIDRVVAARNKLRGMVGLSTTGGSGGGGVEARGVERGALRAGAGRFRSGVSMLGGGLVGGLLGYASVEGVKQAVDFTKELALNTRTLSAVTGMDNKNAAEWIAITDARGIKTRSFAANLKALSTQTESALTGSKKSVEMFKALGISTDELKKHSGDLSSMLGLVADHLNKMPGGAEKTAIASKLLGRNYTALMPMLLQGSKGMADQRREAAALGITLGGNAAENAKKLEEASVRLKISQEALQVQFAEHVAPAIITVTEDGIKLFGVLRRDLGPAVHFVTGEVKDISHWLEKHQTVLHGVEIALGTVAGAYVALKVIGGTVRLIRGLSNDFNTAKTAVSGLAHPISSLKTLFGEQETESQALMRAQTALADANDRLAVSFERVATASKGAAGGEVLAGEAGGLAGGAPMLTGAAGGAAAAEGTALAGGAARAGMSEAQLAQDGVLGAMVGKQGVASIRQSLKSALGTAGKGLMFGLLGNQFGGMLGGAVGGKTGAGFGSAIGTGAGIGMAFGPEGAAAGAAVGALVHFASTFSGDNDAQIQKLAGEMRTAAQAGDFSKLHELGTQAAEVAKGMHSLGVDDLARKLSKLSSQADTAAQSLRLRRAGAGVASLEQTITGSRFAPTVDQISLGTIGKLRGLGSQAQQAGADAMVKFTAGLEANKRLPVGSTNKLITQLENYYGPSFARYLQGAGSQSMAAIENSVAQSKVVSKVQNQVDQMHKTWGLLVPDVKVTSGNVRQVMTDNIEAMRQKVLDTTGKERTDAIDHLNKLLTLYAQYTPLIAGAGEQAFRNMSSTVSGILTQLGTTLSGTLGGWVSVLGTFTQAVTPELQTLAGAISGGALATPAGANQLLNILQGGFGAKPKKADGGYFHGTVPGDHTRDGTLAWLSGREFVMTGDGQAMMDSYAPGLLDHIAASQAPHFATGGKVGFSGRISTYGPPLEPAGTTANGQNSSRPGISLRIPGTGYNDPRNRALMGHKFLLQFGGHQAVAEDFDLGPNQSTGRVIDVTGALAQQMGVNPARFPTDSIGTVTQLGAHASSAARLSLQPNASTTYSPRGPGLSAGFWQGYQYGVDPTTGLSRSAALHDAILGAQLKSSTTQLPGAVRFSVPAGGSIPAGDRRALGVYSAMMGAAGRIVGKPYGHAGGHGSWNASNYDCSGAVGYLLHAAGLTNQFQWTGSLASWGLPGDGKYVTVGLRDPQSQNSGHAMINFFGRYLESGGGGPLGKPSVHWDSGWDGVFPYHRHPPGLRRGGRVPGHGPVRRPGRFRAGGRLGDPRLSGNANEADARRFRLGGMIRRFRSGGPTGANWGYVQPGAGAATGGGVHYLSGRPAAPQLLPSSLQYWPITSVAGANMLQPIEHYDYGTGATSHATTRMLGGEIHGIGQAGSNRQVQLTLTAFSRSLENVRKVSYTGLISEAKTLERDAKQAAGHGDRQQATRYRQALQLVYQQEGKRVGSLVRTATDEAAAIDTANKRLQNLMTRSQIDPASAQGTAMIAKFQDQSVRVLKDEVRKLQRAYQLAQKAGDKNAVGDIAGRLSAALASLDDATATAVQDHVDQVKAAQQAVADSAQANVDTATHTVTMASTGEQNLQMEQQLSGTSGTMAGAQQLENYINQSVVPAMQKQVATLQAQQDVASQQGNTTLAQQIAEQIGQTQNGILQEQLTAQQAIQQAAQQTAQNTAPLAGALAVSYGSVSLPDIAGFLNGA